MSDLTWTGLILGATLVLFVTERIRLEIAALLGLLAFILSGVLTVEEGLAGFSEPLTVMLCGLFIVGDALARTGVAERLGDGLLRLAGGGAARLTLATMLASALLSAFMSSTGAVAMLLPVALQLARRAEVPASRLLMPLAFAALFGGMLTLIGTPPNLVVSAQLAKATGQPFGFFAFTPLGLALTAAGMGLILLLGGALLPAEEGGEVAEGSSPPRLAELIEGYGLAGQTFRLRLRGASPLAGRRVGEARLREDYGLSVLDIRSWEGRDEATERAVGPQSEITPGAVLVLRGEAEAIARLGREAQLDILPGAEGEDLLSRSVGVAELVIAPRSRYIGRSLKDLGFRERTGVHVVAMRRKGTLLEGFGEQPLAFADSLLIQGPWSAIARLRERWQDLIVTGEPQELAEERRAEQGERAPWALGIVAAMLLAMSMGWAPNVAIVIAAGIAVVLSGCVPAGEAWRAVNWPSVVLIAAMLPAATALDKTGGVALLVDLLDGALGGAGPRAVLAGLFVVTAGLSLVMSNTATTVILAPVALLAAERLQVRPEAFLMGVAMAASTAFATPMASPVNTLVLTAGGYRFVDYLKLGAPLMLAMGALTVLLAPWLFPLAP